MEAEEARLGVVPEVAAQSAGGGGTRAAVAAMLERTPRLERLVYRATGRTKPTRVTYDSPVDAARAADETYA